jgi:plasmid stability protein
MGSLTIRKFDDALKASLRLRAARHGRSMEEEARVILRGALAVEPPKPGESLGEMMRAFVEEYGPIDIDLPPREPARDPPDFSGPDFAE